MNVRCTVLLPVHNGMPYLPEALDSILQQTERELKVIILDDGSTDGTKEYLRSLADSRLTIITVDRIGLPAVLNHGLTMVTTEYVARMDADDVASYERIRTQCDYLDSHPSCIIIGSSVRYIGERGNGFLWKTTVPSAHTKIIEGLFSRKSVLFHPSIVMRTDVVRQCGGYQTGAFPAEDYDLYLRLSSAGEFANIEDVLLSYRVTGHSIVGLKFLQSLRMYQYRIEIISGRNFSTLERLFFRCDEYGLVFYRKGLQEYLNGSRLRGFTYFAFSMVMNPMRVLRYINRVMN
jgi:glycosyltransferase involved in cell wall biosynthesis